MTARDARAAFVLGFVAVVAAVAWRDYRARLEPESRQLRELAEAWRTGR